MPTIKLEVISPDAVVYQADIDMLVVRSQAGELGILPHHMPMIAGILPCAMRVKLVDREELIAVAGGFMEVQRDKITILASCAELPIQIDELRAQKAYDRAKEWIHSFHVAPRENAHIDIERAELALQRALARLKAVHSMKR